MIKRTSLSGMQLITPLWVLDIIKSDQVFLHLHKYEVTLIILNSLTLGMADKDGRRHNNQRLGVARGPKEISMSEKQLIHSLRGIIDANASSSKYPNLNRDNERALIERIVEDPEANRQFKELYNNREYYNKKLNTYLSGLVPTADPSTDATRIVDRATATKYCQLTFKPSEPNTKALRTIITSHWGYQLQWHDQRQQLATKYSTQLKELESLRGGDNGNLCGKMKLAGLHDQKVARLQQEFNEALAKFDQEVYQQCRELTADNVSELARLRVPYFCLRSDLEYEGLDDDKQWVLQHLYEVTGLV